MDNCSVHYGENNLRSKPTRTKGLSRARTRSKSPILQGPWIPPPGKTSRATKISQDDWKDPMVEESHDYVKVQTQINNYEKKIDDLMFEVGSLKNEVELQKSLRDIEKKDVMLETTKQLVQEQERQINDMRGELNASTMENRNLRRNLNQLHEEAEDKRVECDILNSERDKLMRKLIEVEMDSKAATKQVSELHFAIRRLVEETKLPSTDTNKFTRQKDALLSKLSEFEMTNQTLRRMLRDRHTEEADIQRLSEQKDILMQQLQSAEREKEKLSASQLGSDQKVLQLENKLASQKDEIIALNRLQRSLENTRAHLQRQLCNKEADCNRMAVQIQTLEKQLSQKKIDTEHLQEMVKGAKEKAEKDKESLKKATRVLKQRASQSDDAVEQMNLQLLERESLLADMTNKVQQYKERGDKLSKEKTETFSECSSLKIKLRQKENELSSQINKLTNKLQEKTSECTKTSLENEKMKSSLVTFETKLSQAENERIQLKANIKQYEEIMDEYKNRMTQSRKEADDTLDLLEEQQKQSSRLQREGEIELEKVKKRLQQRLQELEPLPELLKNTELKLQDADEKTHLFERKNSDNYKVISELTSKMERLTSLYEELKDKWYGIQEENRMHQSKIDTLQRKLRESEDQNRELLNTISKREETIHQNNLHLEEKTRENISLTHQLENAIADLKRQTNSVSDRIASKERSSQTKILELESQMSQARADIIRVKREKEENERKFNSRLYDLKDRLEQSHSTNRSMQNYVQFLKNSYANVYGDMTGTQYQSALL